MKTWIAPASFAEGLVDKGASFAAVGEGLLLSKDRRIIMPETLARRIDDSTVSRCGCDSSSDCVRTHPNVGGAE